ncbi:hypothetical protein DOY81_000592 [Sarcophaga bullata]|nr:hypothetical protein DOY81_000592 [Sarcophaga bullata]
MVRQPMLVVAVGSTGNKNTQKLIFNYLPLASNVIKLLRIQQQQKKNAFNAQTLLKRLTVKRLTLKPKNTHVFHSVLASVSYLLGTQLYYLKSVCVGFMGLLISLASMCQ